MANSSIQKIDFSEALDALDQLARFRKWCREAGKGEVPKYLADALDATPHGRDLWSEELPDAEDKELSGLIFSKEMDLRYRIADSLSPVLHEVRDDQGSRIPRSSRKTAIRIPPTVRKSVIMRDEGICQSCGRKWHPPDRHSESDPALPAAWNADFSIDHRSKRPMMDHIIPAYHGGVGKPWNVWTLCPACNERKGTHLWHPSLRMALERLHSGDGYKQLDPPQEQFIPVRSLIRD